LIISNLLTLCTSRNVVGGRTIVLGIRIRGGLGSNGGLAVLDEVLASLTGRQRWPC